MKLQEYLKQYDHLPISVERDRFVIDSNRVLEFIIPAEKTLWPVLTRYSKPILPAYLGLLRSDEYKKQIVSVFVTKDVTEYRVSVILEEGEAIQGLQLALLEAVILLREKYKIHLQIKLYIYVHTIYVHIPTLLKNIKSFNIDKNLQSKSFRYGYKTL